MAAHVQGPTEVKKEPADASERVRIRLQNLRMAETKVKKETVEEYTQTFDNGEEQKEADVEVRIPKNVKLIEHWGQAKVKFGKCNGKTYSAAYEDESYRKWLISHYSTLTAPAAKDLAGYMMVRRQQELGA